MKKLTFHRPCKSRNYYCANSNKNKYIRYEVQKANKLEWAWRAYNYQDAEQLDGGKGSYPYCFIQAQQFENRLKQ